MPRKWLRRWLPDHEKMAKNTFLKHFGHWFTDPRLWHLNRRSVAGGVAAGVIGGGLMIVVAIGQIFSPAPYGHPVERPIE